MLLAGGTHLVDLAVVNKLLDQKLALLPTECIREKGHAVLGECRGEVCAVRSCRRAHGSNQPKLLVAKSGAFATTTHLQDSKAR